MTRLRRQKLNPESIRDQTPARVMTPLFPNLRQRALTLKRYKRGAFEPTAAATLDPFAPVSYHLFRKGARGENRSINRILRRLKLHAEGRQFGYQDSRT